MEITANFYAISLIVVWVTTLLIFFLITLAYKSRNTAWGNFWEVLIVTSVIVGVIVLFMIKSPNQVSKIYEWFGGLLKV